MLQVGLSVGDLRTVEVSSTPEREETLIEVAGVLRLAPVFMNAAEEVETPHVGNRKRESFTRTVNDLFEPLLGFRFVANADAADDPRFFRDISGQVEDGPDLARRVEDLIHRKRSLFGDDWRCIGTWEVRKTAEGFDVRRPRR